MILEPDYQRLGKKAGLAIGFFIGLFALLIEKRGASSSAAWSIIAPLAATLSAVILYWHLRKQPWFWATIGALAVLQAVLFFFIPVPNVQFHAQILLPVAFLDLVLLLLCIKFVGRLITHSE